MLEFAHALSGTVIAYKFHNPALGLLLALASHFAIDLLPHWNFGLDEEKKEYGKISKKTVCFLVGDCLLGLALGLYIASKAYPDLQKVIIVLTGGLLGVLPDLVEAPFYFLGIKNKHIDKLLAFQKAHQWNVSFWPGIISQVIFVVALLLIA
jgi:hypothetical protein